MVVKLQFFKNVCITSKSLKKILLCVCVCGGGGGGGGGEGGGLGSTSPNIV